MFQSRVGDEPRDPAPSGTAATRTVQLAAYNARLVLPGPGHAGTTYAWFFFLGERKGLGISNRLEELFVYNVYNLNQLPQVSCS